MEHLADVLKNTSVISLVNAKPMKKKTFIYLQEDDTIRTALQTFINNDIESIPIKKTGLIFAESEFTGMLSLVNLLKFILAFPKDQNSSSVLDMKLEGLTASTELIKKIEFISPHSSLMHLLLTVWGGSCKLSTDHIDCKHLLTTTLTGKYEVITPLDFLRHLLFLNIKENAFLRDSPATEIENGFDVDENLITHWGQELRVAIDRIVRSNPIYLLAVVDEDTGALEANITFPDLLPSNFEKISSSISFLRDPNISLKSYLESLRISQYSIDPILLYPRYSILDVIEKLTRLKIHHLWRVSQDATQRPLGAVGVADILRYLTFMFRPFEEEKLKASEDTNGTINCELSNSVN